VIEAFELSKSYGSTCAVDGLSFSVAPGCVTGFLGPNGAGKTTTMRLILGLDAPTAGVVTVNGRRYTEMRLPLHEVGALLEARALHGGRRAYDHLLCLAQSNGIARSRVATVLDQVGLSDVARKRAGTFSLGMSQRLGIAAALLGDPDVLMFDEPVNGLDPEGIVWIRNLLRGLAGEGRTILVSSHLMSEMAQTADRLIVIGQGKLIAQGSIDELTAMGRRWVRVRSPRLAELVPLLTGPDVAIDAADDTGSCVVRGLGGSDIGDIAATHGIALHELVEQRASLEEVFFSLTESAVDYHGSVGSPATFSGSAR
jgi:ABC-2 type transport system ATP-binding protein